MFFVVVVHCGGYLGQIGPVNMGLVAGRAAIACDPVFFALSGYSALRPLKRGLRDYYQKKLVGIVVPLVVYSALLYLWSSRLTELSIGGYFAFAAGEIGSPWWFIPTLIPFLVLAPFLCQFFEALSDKWALRLCKLVLVASLWSCLSYFGQWLFVAIGKPGAASMIETITYLIPTHLVSVGYFVFFCAGYFLRRMMPLLSKKNKKQLIAIGFLFWALDATALYVESQLRIRATTGSGSLSRCSSSLIASRLALRRRLEGPCDGRERGRIPSICSSTRQSRPLLPFCTMGRLWALSLPCLGSGVLAFGFCSSLPLMRCRCFLRPFSMHWC